MSKRIENENIINDKKIDLFQISFKHVFYSDGDREINDLVSICVNLTKEYDNLLGEYSINKKVIVSKINDEYEIEEEVKTDTLDLEKFYELEKIDLNSLKNSYMGLSEDINDYWVVEYNNMFKIVGIYNLMPTEIGKVYDMLDVYREKKKIISDRIKMN